MGVEDHSTGPQRIPGTRLVRYLRPLLSKECETSWSDGRALHLGSQRLRYHVLRPIRQRVLIILEQIGRSDDLAAVGEAIDVFGHVLRPLSPTFGREVTDEELAEWTEERLDALSRILAIYEHHASDAVSLRVLQEIRWHADRSDVPELRMRAAALVERIRARLRNSLVVAMVPAGRLEDDDSEEAVQDHRIAIDRWADEIGAGDTASGISALESHAAALDALKRRVFPAELLFEIARRRPEAGEAILRRILAEPTSPLAPWTHAILAGLLNADSARTAEMLDTVIADGGEAALRSAAAGHADPRWYEQLGEVRWTRNVETLLSNPSILVRRSSLEALRQRGIPPRPRLELVLAFEDVDDPAAGKSWVETITWTDLLEIATSAEEITIAHRLGRVRDWEHWAGELLKRLCPKVPDAVVEMLLIRLAREADGTESYGSFLDLGRTGALSTLPATQRERLLQGIGRYLDDGDRAWVHAEELFQQLADAHPEDARAVRMEWAVSEDVTVVVRSARSLGNAEPEALFMERELVVTMLREARKLGAECFEEVRSRLLGRTHGGLRTGTSGEPPPRDVAIHAQAMSIAEEFPAGTVEATFYRDVARIAQSSIDRALQWFEREDVS